MTNKEVVDRLKNISCVLQDYLSSNEVRALQQAIKCVELMPGLVDALDDARAYLKDSERRCYFEVEINEYRKLIDKAKELV